MPPTVLSVPLPLQPDNIPNHPALTFYAAYGKKFPKTKEKWDAQAYDEFYAEDFKMHHVDGSLVVGGKQAWEWVRKLYADFPGIEREMLEMLVVTTDDGKGNATYRIHLDLILKVPQRSGNVAKVPQAFVYTLGKADEGKGMLGLQFRELRNYYDLRTLENAQNGSK